MRIVRIGEQYSIVGSTVETYDVLPVKTYVTLYSKTHTQNQRDHYANQHNPNNQPKWTLLYKEKIDKSSGEKEILYDRLKKS